MIVYPTKFCAYCTTKHFPTGFFTKQHGPKHLATRAQQGCGGKIKQAATYVGARQSVRVRLLTALTGIIVDWLAADEQ